MKTKQIAIGAVVLVGLIWYAGSSKEAYLKQQQEQEQLAPEEAEGWLTRLSLRRELGKVFGPNPSVEAREDALKTALMIDALDAAVRYDQAKQPESRRFKHDLDLQDMRQTTVEFYFEGHGVDAKYQGFGAAVGEYLEKELGTESGTLTSKRIRQWHDAHKAIAAELKHIAE